MKVMNTIPKGRVFSAVSENELQKRNKFYESAEALGLNITTFDSSVLDLSAEEEKQYEEDSAMATYLLLEEREIPQDLKERLLKVKALREKKE